MIDDGMFSKKKPAKCPKCGCEWFELKKFERFADRVGSMYAMPAPYDGFSVIFLLKCAKCGELMEPSHETSSIPADMDEYNKFMEIIEEKKKEQK